jgi:hypothetical protein
MIITKDLFPCWKLKNCGGGIIISLVGLWVVGQALEDAHEGLLGRRPECLVRLAGHSSLCSWGS